MKFDFNKKYSTIAIYACMVIAFALVFALCVFNLSSVWGVVKTILNALNPVIYGFVIAFILNPLYRLFERKVFKFVSKKKKRAVLQRVLSLVAAYLVLALLITLFAVLIVPQLVSGFNELQSKMGDYVKNVQKWVEKTLEKTQEKHPKNFLLKIVSVENLIESINKFISNWSEMLSAIMPTVRSFVGSVIDVVKNMAIGFVISIYFLFSRDKLCAQIKKSVYALFKKERADNMVRLTRFTSNKFESFITGRIIDALIMMALTFVVLTIFNIPYPALIAVIVGVTNVIPFFGPFIGAIPSAFIVFIANPYDVIWFIVIIFILQQLDGNVICPMIVGERMGLSALWVVVSLLLMGGLLGMTGLFVGVPLFAVVYAFFSDFVERRLLKKELPVDTDAYYRSPEEDEHKHTSGMDSRPVRKAKAFCAKIRDKRAKRGKGDDAEAVEAVESDAAEVDEAVEVNDAGEQDNKE